MINQELINVFKNCRELAKKRINSEMLNIELYDATIKILETQPQRNRGEWLEDPKTGLKSLCSECGARNIGANRNYCPNCGSYNAEIKEKADD